MTRCGAATELTLKPLRSNQDNQRLVPPSTVTRIEATKKDHILPCLKRTIVNKIPLFHNPKSTLGFKVKLSAVFKTIMAYPPGFEFSMKLSHGFHISEVHILYNSHTVFITQ